MRYGELKNEVTNIGTAVSDVTKTVNDIDKKVDKFQLHFTDVSGRLDEKVKAAHRPMFRGFAVNSGSIPPWGHRICV